VNDGIKRVAEILQNESWELAIGTGTTNPWYDNQTLENETERADATVTIISTTMDSDTLNFHIEVVLTEEKIISEFGVFHKTTGKMLVRAIQVPVPVPVGYTFYVDYIVQIKS